MGSWRNVTAQFTVLAESDEMALRQIQYLICKGNGLESLLPVDLAGFDPGTVEIDKLRLWVEDAFGVEVAR